MRYIFYFLFNDLMTILITLINSSSAFIERYKDYVCGVINTDRNQNMKHDLFEIYAYLTSNMHILHTLKIQ